MMILQTILGALQRANSSALAFMRKGEVGDWKNYFTPEQSAEMDKVCPEKLNGSGLEFDFGDTC